MTSRNQDQIPIAVNFWENLEPHGHHLRTRAKANPGGACREKTLIVEA
jgi:hypothetical protein